MSARHSVFGDPFALIEVDGYKPVDELDSGSVRVELHMLSAYQVAFLRENCDLVSACHGTIYVQIAKDPEGMVIGAEIISAELDAVNEDSVLQKIAPSN